MAIIKPFKAFRYNTEKIKDLNLVLTQPYDKISKDKQESYYKKSDYNLVRIILNKSTGKDKYQEAAKHLEKWIQEKILIQDQKEAIYYYTQTYQDPYTGQPLTRSGLIVLGKLSRENVHAHERTLAAPKKDRLNLLRTTKANFGQIFMLYEDTLDEINQTIRKFSTKADIEVTDEDNNKHKCTIIDDPKTISQVKHLLKNKPLFIADGHHRYETALNFSEEMKAKGLHTEAMDYRMMTLVNFHDPGLSILPTHRLLKDIPSFNIKHLLQELEKYFFITKHERDSEVITTMRKEKSPCFGIYSNDSSYYSLKMRKSPVTANFDKELDVVILHKLILEKTLKLTPKSIEDQKNITYIRNHQKGIDLVKNKKAQVLFLLNPTKKKEIIDIASQGLRMPQKSTDFYPKLLSGLTIYKMPK